MKTVGGQTVLCFRDVTPDGVMLNGSVGVKPQLRNLNTNF